MNNDNSKPSTSSGHSRQPADNKKSEDASYNDKLGHDDEKINLFTNYTRSLMKKLKKQSKESIRQLFKTGQPNQSELIGLSSSVEENIEELFNKVIRQVLNFLEKDIINLENHSNEEKDHTKKLLSEYKIMMEKIMTKQMKNVDTFKIKVQTGIISQVEIEKFISAFDKEMNAIMGVTETMFKNINKSELDLFKKNLKNVLENCRDKIESSNDLLIENLKTPGQNSTQTIIKLPNMSRIFASMPKLKNSQSQINDLKYPMSFSSMKGKLPSFNIKKHINSETPIGRANTAKVTYLGVLIGFIYWKWKSSKSST
ncbi:hypothetical protein PV328_005625 [Microctonus aethiopoides]|uniref:Uncharacterized protein n=1 Tax=Microctonus aethiopoides TaxID=144406 RepID=A0AA39FMN4_9HYME|nr:hypothetical protein PV328_005625 [Microctonus aethiopoides]